MESEARERTDINPDIIDNGRNRNSEGQNGRNNYYNGKNSFVRGDKRYMKECTVTIEGIDSKRVKAYDVIKAIEIVTGLNSVLAVVDSDALSYEVTLDSKENAVKLLSGIEINDRDYNCSLIFSDTTVVSFMKLPSYIEDWELKDKLTSKGIKLVSPIFRRAVSGTDVADGTRFVKCKFPPGFVSLPWTTGFKIGSSIKYYRVVHNNQAKVCSLCMSPEHIQRNCPHYECNGCGLQGHYERRCRAFRCTDCHELPLKCKCEKNNDNSHPSQNDDRHQRPWRSNRYEGGFGSPPKCDRCDVYPCQCSAECNLCNGDPCVCPCPTCGQGECRCELDKDDDMSIRTMSNGDIGTTDDEEETIEEDGKESRQDNPEGQKSDEHIVKVDVHVENVPNVTDVTDVAYSREKSGDEVEEKSGDEDDDSEVIINVKTNDNGHDSEDSDTHLKEIDVESQHSVVMDTLEEDVVSGAETGKDKMEVVEDSRKRKLEVNVIDSDDNGSGSEVEDREADDCDDIREVLRAGGDIIDGKKIKINGDCVLSGDVLPPDENDNVLNGNEDIGTSDGDKEVTTEGVSDMVMSSACSDVESESTHETNGELDSLSRNDLRKQRKKEKQLERRSRLKITPNLKGKHCRNSSSSKEN